MTEMVRVTRGMLLHQPWANLVVEGIFPVLVRAHPTTIRELVAVIAYGRDELALVDGKSPDVKQFPEPAVVGYVKLAGCVSVPSRGLLTLLRRRYGKVFVDFYPKHYIPDKPTLFLWILARPRRLRRPRQVFAGQNFIVRNR